MRTEQVLTTIFGVFVLTAFLCVVYPFGRDLAREAMDSSEDSRRSSTQVPVTAAVSTPLPKLTLGEDDSKISVAIVADARNETALPESLIKDYLRRLSDVKIEPSPDKALIVVNITAFKPENITFITAEVSGRGPTGTLWILSCSSCYAGDDRLKTRCAELGATIDQVIDIAREVRSEKATTPTSQEKYRPQSNK